MYKRLLTLLALITMLLSLLCSCFLMNQGDTEGGGDDNNNTETEEEEKLPEGGIYNSKSELYLIREEGLDEDLFVAFMDKYNNADKMKMLNKQLEVL